MCMKIGDKEDMKKFWKGLPIWFKGGLLLAMLPVINYGITRLAFSRCVASGGWDCSVGAFVLFFPSLIPVFIADSIFHFGDVFILNTQVELLVTAVIIWFLMGALGSIIVKQLVELVKSLDF